MRFLVDLYRVLILAGLAIALIAGSYLVLMSFGRPGGAELGGYVLTMVIATAIIVIFGIGMTATFISIHDRLAEIADNSARIANALERGNPPPGGHSG